MGSDLEELCVELVDLFGESDWVVEYDVFGDAAVVVDPGWGEWPWLLMWRMYAIFILRWVDFPSM